MNLYIQSFQSSHLNQQVADITEKEEQNKSIKISQILEKKRFYLQHYLINSAPL